MNNIRIKKHSHSGIEFITLDVISVDKNEWYEIPIKDSDPLYEEFLKLYNIAHGRTARTAFKQARYIGKGKSS